MTSKAPTVSIGLPVFNGENYLASAIESILAQTFKDFELIISDNGSTDRTKEICHAFASRDARVKYYPLEENMGAAFNYNRVFALSTGTYFRWAAHDDTMLPDYLRVCVEEFQKRAGDPVPPSIVHPKSNIIDGDGEVTGPDLEIEVLNPRRPVRVYKMVRNMGATAVFGLMPRKTLAQTRLIGNFLASDFCLLLELAILGPVVQVDQVLFCRRVHSSMSTKANRAPSNLIAWFDPTARARLFPRVAYNREYFRSVWNVGELTYLERSACTVTLSGAVFVQALRYLRLLQGRQRRHLVSYIVSYIRKLSDFVS